MQLRFVISRPAEESLVSIAESLARIADAAGKITGKGSNDGPKERVEGRPEKAIESLRSSAEGDGGVEGDAGDGGFQRDREHEGNAQGAFSRRELERYERVIQPPPMPAPARTQWVLRRVEGDLGDLHVYLANCSTRRWTVSLEEAHRFVKEEDAEASIGTSDAVPVEVYA